MLRVTLLDFIRPRPGFFPVPGLLSGGAGGESRGSGGHPIALYTGSFFPFDAVPSGGRVPDLHRLPFSTEGHLISSILLPGCASLVAAFGTHFLIMISSFPFQRLPSCRSVPAGAVYTGWPFSRLDFVLPYYASPLLLVHVSESKSHSPCRRSPCHLRPWGGGVGRPGPAAHPDGFFPLGYCFPGGHVSEVHTDNLRCG